MVRVVLNLTKAQLRKLQSGKAFQMSKAQLESGEGHEVELDVDRKLGNKINRCIQGRGPGGFRIPKGLVSAGVNLARANTGKLADYGAKMASQAVQKQIANSTYIPESMKGDVSKLANAGISNIKTAGLNRVDGRLAEYQGEGFGTFVKAMKKVGSVAAPIAKTVAKVALPVAGQMAGAYVGGPMGSEIGRNLGKAGADSIGNGIRKKGSAEAKAHMARIRAMKGKGIMDMAKKAVKAGAPLAKQAVKAYGADAVAMLAQKSGVIDPKLARNVAQTAIKMSGMGIPPRYKPSGRILRNGIDLPVPGPVVLSGNGYSGWGYA